MSATESTAVPEWRVEQFRLTAFAASFPDSLWQALTGEAPENRIVNPRLGAVREEGSYKDGELVVSILESTRLDIVFGKPGDLAFLGPLPGTLDLFVPVVERWFSTAPEVERLAFGLVLHYPVESIRQGYERLTALLPNVRIDLDNSSEFFYQINRRRESKSGVDQLKLNRLSKWSVALRQSANLVVGQAGTSIVRNSAPMISCRLELDINTSPDYGQTLSKDSLSTVFGELVSLAVEISKEGDVP